MNQYMFLVVLLSTLCIHDSYGIATPRKSILRGRVLFTGASNLIESGSKMNVQLQDTSLADAPAQVISQYNSSATRFPIAFALKYSPSSVINGFRYSLSVRIVNNKNELLYINDVYTPVTLTGADRTKFIDVSVIRVKQPSSVVVSKTQWPEVVGMTGEQAVKLIKEETGFPNVMTVLEGSPVTLDYRTDRVRVFVDTKGIVRNTPTVG